MIFPYFLLLRLSTEAHSPRLGSLCPGGSNLARQMKVKLSVTQSCRTLCYPWTVVHQAPLSMEFSRQDYWSGLPFPSPGDLLNPEIESRSPALQADSLPSEPPGEKPSRWPPGKVMEMVNPKPYRISSPLVSLLSLLSSRWNLWSGSPTLSPPAAHAHLALSPFAADSSVALCSAGRRGWGLPGSRPHFSLWLHPWCSQRTSLPPASPKASPHPSAHVSTFCFSACLSCLSVCGHARVCTCS